MGYSEKGKQGFQSTHCLRSHPLYRIWQHMKNRCFNKNSNDYKDYGARGIIVCEDWKTDFVEFLYWSIKNGWKEGLSIERKDYNGNYEPANCCWIQLSEQSKNRRGLRLIEFNGQIHTLSEWSRITGIKRSTLKQRLTSGNFTLEEAFNVPVNQNLARR